MLAVGTLDYVPSLCVKYIHVTFCMMSENINIRISSQTKQGLIELGRKDQTYNDIVSELIKKEKAHTLEI